MALLGSCAIRRREGNHPLPTRTMLPYLTHFLKLFLALTWPFIHSEEGARRWRAAGSQRRAQGSDRSGVVPSSVGQARPGSGFPGGRQGCLRHACARPWRPPGVPDTPPVTDRRGDCPATPPTLHHPPAAARALAPGPLGGKGPPEALSAVPGRERKQPAP